MNYSVPWSFLSPWMLLAVGAASVPVILHFFFRSRFRTVPWAAMKFLLTSIEQTSRRLRIQELILLFVRMLVIGLLAVAAARLVAPTPGTTAIATVLAVVPIATAFAAIVLLVVFAEHRFEASRAGTMLVLVGVLAFFFPQVYGGYYFLAVAPEKSQEKILGDASTPVDAVFLIDVSYSMQARAGKENRLHLARQAALDLIDKLPPYSTAQVIRFADRSELLGPRIPANLEQARFLVQNLKGTHLTGDLLPALREAEATFAKRKRANKHLFILSDMQRNCWQTQPNAVRQMLAKLRREAGITLIHCGSPLRTNLAVTEILPQKDIPQPGRRVDFAVTVHNTSQETIPEAQVEMVFDGDAENGDSKSLRFLEPGESRSVVLSAKMTTPGLHIVTARVKADGLTADNRRDRVIRVREALRILVVDGNLDKEHADRSASFYLLHALAPVADRNREDYPIQPTVVTPKQVFPEMLDDYDLCVLADVSLKADLSGRVPHLPEEFLTALDSWVRKGGGLLIFPGDHTDRQAYNRELYEARRLLPYRITGLIQRPTEQPLYLDRDSANLPVYRRFREDRFYEPLNKTAMAWKVLSLEPETSLDLEHGDAGDSDRQSSVQRTAVVALRFSEGGASGGSKSKTADLGPPAVVSHRVGAGEVMLFTTAANPGRTEESNEFEWTNLPALPYWIPLIELTVQHLRSGLTRQHNAEAGVDFQWLVPESETERSFVLYRPDGTKKHLGLPTAAGARHVLQLHGLELAGIYYLLGRQANDKGPTIDPTQLSDLSSGRLRIGHPIAITPDLREGEDLTSLTAEQIDALLGFAVAHQQARADRESALSGEAVAADTAWWWLVVAVLGLTVGEGILAWFCGRPV